jgi:integral membrane protein
MKQFKTTLHTLRMLGFGEAISWLFLLGFAMPLKYIWHQPIFVKYVGWVHGLLFLAYIFQAFKVSKIFNWNSKRFLTACVAAFLPFGTFIFDKSLKKEEETIL